MIGGRGEGAAEGLGEKGKAQQKGPREGKESEGVKTAIILFT